MVPEVRNPPAKAGDTIDISLIPQLGRSPGRTYGNLPQYSCLEAIRYMKRFSASLIIREMEIKIIMRYHLYKWLLSQKQEIKTYWQGCRDKGALVYWYWELKLVQSL